MFDTEIASVGLPAGEADTTSAWCDDGFDDFVYQLAVDELNTGWVDGDRHVLPSGLEDWVPGPFLAVVLDSVDRSKLNGFDLVRVLRARERLISHCQGESMVDMVEVSYAAAGDASSDPERRGEAFEYASDEIRAGLCLTRRTAEFRMSFAADLCERLPRVWKLFSDGVIDVPRVRVISNGTAHLTDAEARDIVDVVADRAPRLTSGQLAAWIRRSCVESDPVKAENRYEQAKADRRLVIEQTESGTGNVHLLDIDICDARAIGRRVNAHMVSMRKDGDTRSHDSLRADITVDLLLGSDPANGGGRGDGGYESVHDQVGSSR